MTITFGDDITIGNTYEKYGLVCAMDVLGVRRKTLDESRVMLEKVTQLIKQFKLQQMEAAWKLNRDKRFPLDQEWQYYSKLAPLDVFFAGDMFFICCRFNDAPLELNIPKATGSILEFFRLAMQCDMMMRGAISIDHYLWKNGGDLVLGPAVNDAVEYCEQADWIGLHLTPNAGHKLDSLMEKFQIRSKNFFMKYQVPLTKPKCACSGECKGYISHAEFWCVNWPVYFCDFSRDPAHSIASGRAKIETIFSKNKPSSGKAVSKYTNSSAFFEAYAKWYTDFWWSQYKYEFDREIASHIQWSSESES